MSCTPAIFSSAGYTRSLSMTRRRFPDGAPHWQSLRPLTKTLFLFPGTANCVAKKESPAIARFSTISRRTQKKVQVRRAHSGSHQSYVVPNKFKNFFILAWGFTIAPIIAKLYAECRQNDQEARRQDRRHHRRDRRDWVGYGETIRQRRCICLVTGRRQKELDEAVKAIGTNVSGSSGRRCPIG